MNELSPSASRISAALRALRQIYNDSATDKAVLGLKSLQAVMAELAADGVPAEDLKPLAALETLLCTPQAEPRTPEPVAPAWDPDKHQRDRRRKAPPSTTLLARSAAVIDLLVKDGQTEDQAAQRVMRHLLLTGVPAPEQGGDSRGWRRLLEFRTALSRGTAPSEALEEYAAFCRELGQIPTEKRLHAVLNERLWDRRREFRREEG